MLSMELLLSTYNRPVTVVGLRDMSEQNAALPLMLITF